MCLFYLFVQSLCQFATRVLTEMDVTVTDISTELSSGVNFVMMMGLLEGYYVPQYLWHPNPRNFDDKVGTLFCCQSIYLCRHFYI